MTDVGVVLGVGASRGLGAALVRRYARGGLRVLVVGRTEEKLARVVEEVRAAGGAADRHVADVTSEAQTAEAFAAAAKHGPVRAVVYNAGGNWPIPFEKLTPQQFEEFWRLCCLGGFLTAKAALPLLLPHGGSLLFTGASASMRGRPLFAHFAAAKAALRTLAQALAREYGPQGVHVGHVVVDGAIDGERLRTLLPAHLEKLGKDGSLDPDAIAEAFWQLHVQPRSAWTHEIDLRPFKETW